MPAALVLTCTALACGFADGPDSGDAGGPAALLKPGDRVALVGGSFWEEERRGGELETALTLAVPDVTFRHLGWAGDMADQSARRYFKTAKEGRAHLLEHVDLVDPTVIFVAYGQAEALPGGMSVEEYEANMNSLLDELEKRTPRIVLVGPLPAYPASVDSLDADSRLLPYSAATARLTQSRNLPLIQTATWRPLDVRRKRTKNVRLGTDGVSTVHEDTLVLSGRELTPTGLFLERLHLAEPSAAGADELTELIREKNDLFLQRHRPQNETYLRGFRAHEQGNNAAEIKEFEPLVAAKDAAIQTLRNQIVKKASE